MLDGVGRSWPKSKSLQEILFAIGITLSCNASVDGRDFARHLDGITATGRLAVSQHFNTRVAGGRLMR